MSLHVSALNHKVDNLPRAMNFPDLPHYQQLANDLWQWPRARTAIMVGAGFSLNAVPKPGVESTFPQWKDLARAMFDQLHPFIPGHSDVVELDRQFNGSNYLRLASEYEAEFGECRLNQLIQAQVPDSRYLPGSLHYKLMELPWADVFTTNYDTLLERVYIPGRVYSPVIDPAQLTTAVAPRIIKLHGSFSPNTKLIITEEHFRCYPKDFAPFVNTVQQSLLENSFVLVGFSGDDPNFLAWIGWVRDELGDKHAPIYLVGPLGLGNAQRLLLDRRGVKPIDLQPVFTGLKPPQGIHAASLEWFLDSLAAARPPRPENWPNFD